MESQNKWSFAPDGFDLASHTHSSPRLQRGSPLHFLLWSSDGLCERAAFYPFILVHRHLYCFCFLATIDDAVYRFFCGHVFIS